MTQEELKKEVNEIISFSDDSEHAHSEEDRLHLKVIREFCPAWVVEEIEKLDKADFSRWYA